MAGGLPTTIATLALIGAATCGPPNERPAAVSNRDEAIARALDELERFGFAPAEVPVQERGGPDAVDDFEAWLALGFSDAHLDGLAALRDRLEIEPPRTGAQLRRTAAQLRAPSSPVYYAVQREALVFQPAARLGEPLTERALVAALVHAFQDQRMGGLGASVVSSDAPADVARAQMCAAEGHAALAAAVAVRGRAGLAASTADADGFGPVAPKVAGGFAEVACPPAGAFMAEVFRRDGWGGVLQRVGAPPASTEMLAHPSKLDTDFPTTIGLPRWDLDKLGPATLVREDTIGEIGIRHLLIEKGLARADAHRAALGWDGDRLHVYELPTGGKVILWRSLWDRDADADQFRRAIASDAFRIAHQGRRVDAIASDKTELLTALRDHVNEASAPPVEGADAESTAALETD